MNDGVMHACGHDAHTAITLTAAKYLAEHHEGMRGTIYFVFQGAEEIGDHGAYDVMPYLREQGITMALGMHTWEQMKSGTICVGGGTLGRQVRLCLISRSRAADHMAPGQIWGLIRFGRRQT